MNPPLPEQIVAVVTRLAEDLAGWCVQGRDRPLAEHEEAVLARVRAALPLLLQAVVAVATSQLDPRLARARAACPRCGRKATPHQVRTRQLVTTCGTVTLERPWHRCGGCGHGWSVAETVLGVSPHARVSAGLEPWLVRLGATTDFREAAAVLAELTGLALSGETIRRHTVAAGQALAAEQSAAIAQVERTREAAEAVDPAPGLLLVETDGALLRYLDGWHEVKLGLVAGWEGGHVIAPSYVAAREPAERFGPRLAAEAARRGALEIERWEGGVTGRGLAVLRAALVLGDGAAWIWNLADEYVDGRVEVVDYFHARQHLSTLATALFGETPAATGWAEARAGDLLAHGPETVLARLRGLRAPTPAAAEVVRLERGYFTKNAARMQYPQFRLDGLPIGSGAIESAAEHVVQRRMKRAGMRWSDTGADAVLTLRARLRSGRSLIPPGAVRQHQRAQSRAA
jgi:hypothetical protein